MSGNETVSEWIVYLLRCSDSTYYCGITNNLDARVNAHNSGRGAKYTRGRRPVELVWAITAESKSDALSLEARIKTMSRREKDEMVRGD